MVDKVEKKVESSTLIAEAGIQYHKTGYWRKHLNQLPEGSFEITVYYIPVRGDALPGYWSKKFITTLEIAREFYDRITDLDEARMLLDPAPAIRKLN